MKLIEDYRENTEHMTREQKIEYTFTYYWYHMLGVAAVIGFIAFLIMHIAFGMEHPEFTVVLVNQAIDDARDYQMDAELADLFGIEEKSVCVDSDFNISYGDVQLMGVNESSYEKFFFKWDNQEIDAVILPESFYRYCKKLGGSFLDVEELGAAGLPLYEDEGAYRAVYVEETALAEQLSNETGEPLLLAFPTTGTHEEYCRKLVSDLKEKSGE